MGLEEQARWCFQEVIGPLLPRRAAHSNMQADRRRHNLLGVDPLKTPGYQSQTRWTRRPPLPRRHSSHTRPSPSLCCADPSRLYDRRIGRRLPEEHTRIALD